MNGDTMIMTSGYTLRPKGDKLRKYGPPGKSMLKMSQHAEISPHTVARMLTNKGAEDLQMIDLKVLTGIFIDGLEMSPDEFMELKLKDIFDLRQETE